VGSVKTHAGSLVGTPGYMSPEQARGDVEAIGPASDLYALGAILFELLTLAPMHTGATLTALVASTLRPAPLPSAHGNVPPELDAICARATALDPNERGDARAMHDAIERYLAGERDAETRKKQAFELVEKGRALLAKANEGGADSERFRADGMRALGQAVAFDPSDEGALQSIFEVLVSPHRALPPEAAAELKAVELRDRQSASRRSSRMYFSYLAMLPLAFLMGIRSTTAFVVLGSLVVLTMAWSVWMSRAVERNTPAYTRPAICLNYILVGVASLLFGPFVLVPGFVGTSGASMAISIRANLRTRRLILGLSMAAVFVPFALQVLGVLPQMYVLKNNTIEIHPMLIDYPPLLTLLSLCLVTFVQLLIPSLLVGHAVDALIDAEKQNFAQAWRLRQLLPIKSAESPTPK